MSLFIQYEVDIRILYKLKKTDMIFHSVYSKRLFVKQVCLLNKSLYNNDL